MEIAIIFINITLVIICGAIIYLTRTVKNLNDKVESLRQRVVKLEEPAQKARLDKALKDMFKNPKPAIGLEGTKPSIVILDEAQEWTYPASASMAAMNDIADMVDKDREVTAANHEAEDNVVRPEKPKKINLSQAEYILRRHAEDQKIEMAMEILAKNQNKK